MVVKNNIDVRVHEVYPLKEVARAHQVRTHPLEIIAARLPYMLGSGREKDHGKAAAEAVKALVIQRKTTESYQYSCSAELLYQDKSNVEDIILRTKISVLLLDFMHPRTRFSLSPSLICSAYLPIRGLIDPSCPGCLVCKRFVSHTVNHIS